MRAVNLLPRDDGRSRKKAPDSSVLVGGMGAVIVVCVLASMTLLAGGAVDQRQEELQTLQIELQTIPEPAAPPSATEAGLAGERQARAAAVTSALASRIGWDSLLRRFALVLPDDVWLLNLSARTPTGAELPGQMPGGFVLTGYTYSHEGVARLLSRLQVLPDLADVTLQQSTLTPFAGREMVQFSIAANVRPNGPGGVAAS